MHALTCACCGLLIRTRYDGRLVVKRDGHPAAMRVDSWPIHHVCMRRWERENEQAWAWLPLAQLQEVG